jgi:hypothetical protein
MRLKIEADWLFLSSTWVYTRVFKIRSYLLSGENRAHNLILGLSITFVHLKKPSLAAKAYKDNVAVRSPFFVPHSQLPVMS